MNLNHCIYSVVIVIVSFSLGKPNENLLYVSVLQVILHDGDNIQCL